MGVDYQGLRFLLFAKRAGVSFDHPLMFGRQQFGLSLKDAAYLTGKFGWPIQEAILEKWLLGGRYIEPLLEMIGAKDTASIDASDYEGATIVHDMNQPLPSEMKNRFTVAIDFGTLQYVFNYPQALKNAMESVALGGHFIAVTPCNGWAGDGFYQFSPELFFRVLSPENGFELEHQFICECTSRGEWYTNKGWYRCIDPKLLSRKAEIPTACRTYLLIQAKRTKICDVFSNPPQQSYYMSQWAEQPIGRGPQIRTPLWKRLIPKPIKRSTLKKGRERLKIIDITAFRPLDE